MDHLPQSIYIKGKRKTSSSSTSREEDIAKELLSLRYWIAVTNAVKLILEAVKIYLKLSKVKDTFRLIHQLVNLHHGRKFWLLIVMDLFTKDQLTPLTASKMHLSTSEVLITFDHTLNGYRTISTSHKLLRCYWLELQLEEQLLSYGLPLWRKCLKILRLFTV